MREKQFCLAMHSGRLGFKTELPVQSQSRLYPEAWEYESGGYAFEGDGEEFTGRSTKSVHHFGLLEEAH